MLKQKSFYSRRGLIPALAAIAVVAIVGLLASFLVIGNAAQTVTTTQVTTVPTTITANATINSSSLLNAEQIYANANRSIVTIQGTQVQNSFYGNQVASILGSGFVVSLLRCKLHSDQLSRRRHHLESHSDILQRRLVSRESYRIRSLF